MLPNLSKLFEFAMMFYPPKGSALALPMGSNWFLLILINFCLDNEKWGFKNTNNVTPFFIRQKPLSPEGKCLSTHNGVHLILFDLSYSA